MFSEAKLWLAAIHKSRYIPDNICIAQKCERKMTLKGCFFPKIVMSSHISMYLCTKLGNIHTRTRLHISLISLPRFKTFLRHCCLHDFSYILRVIQWDCGTREYYKVQNNLINLFVHCITNSGMNSLRMKPHNCMQLSLTQKPH